MRLLVTGGRGFLGRAVVRALVEHGHDVTAMTSSPGATAEGCPAVSWARADLRDRDTIMNVAAAGRFDGVAHLGARGSVADSFIEPARYFDVNTTGTAHLVSALLAAGQRATVVLMSTQAVYGTEHTDPITEDARPAPASPYAASKLAAETILQGAALTGRITATILRCSNIAGAADDVRDTDTTRLVPRVLHSLATAQPLPVHGDGSTTRDYVHVRDVAAAVRIALTTDARQSSAVYNIGSGAGTSVADLVAAAERVTGRHARIERREPRREARRLVVNIERARQDLTWTPERSDIDSILRDAWYALQTHTAPS